MNWVTNIQNKSREEKIRIIWIVSIIVVIILLGVWAVSYKYRNRVDKDTSFFETISNGIKDVKNNLKKK